MLLLGGRGAEVRKGEDTANRAKSIVLINTEAVIDLGSESCSSSREARGRWSRFLGRRDCFDVTETMWQWPSPVLGGMSFKCCWSLRLTWRK